MVTFTTEKVSVTTVVTAVATTPSVKPPQNKGVATSEKKMDKKNNFPAKRMEKYVETRKPTKPLTVGGGLLVTESAAYTASPNIAPVLSISAVTISFVSNTTGTELKGHSHIHPTLIIAGHPTVPTPNCKTIPKVDVNLISSTTPHPTTAAPITPVNGRTGLVT